MNQYWITADWPVPVSIKTASTFRKGGCSAGCYQSLNLAQHVGDDKSAVAKNRERLKAWLDLPAEPVWLNQVHGTDVVDAACAYPGQTADASYSLETGVVCAIMTADCLPILLYNPKTQAIAAVHGGWRGLLNGIIPATLAIVGSDSMAWLGPAIGPDAFEVGSDVRNAFVQKFPGIQAAFKPRSADKFLADIFAIARWLLKKNGLNWVYGGGCCTYSNASLFFSYRRDGNVGRMATLIWREP